MEVNAKVEAITPKSGVLASINGKTAQFNSDSVVLIGSNPNNELAKQLEGQVSELYVIGDCVKTRRIREAIHEGYRVGLKI